MSFITFLPENKFVPAEKNKSILDIAIDNDIIIEHICGGICSCTSCLILIKKGYKYFNAISEQELYQLKKSEYYSPKARLACVSKIISEPAENIIIDIPPIIEKEDF
jgi:2Fe-2S ferredoxin